MTTKPYVQALATAFGIALGICLYSLAFPSQARAGSGMLRIGYVSGSLTQPAIHKFFDYDNGVTCYVVYSDAVSCLQTRE